MRKFLLSIAVALVASVQGLAIPALPTPFAVTQPDGSQLTVRLHGDEYYNYYTTLDGYTVVKNDAGYYVYAQKNGGVLAPTAVVARPQAERSAADQALLSTLGKNLIDDTRSSASRKARAQRDRAMKASAFDYSKFRGLVVLVQFNDCKFSRSDAADFYEKMINQENYTGYTNEDGSRSTYGAFTGSVRDYFRDNSMGKFNPHFDVVGPVTVNLSVDSPQGTQNMSPLLAQSLKQLKGKVNFADYDTDDDGYVDMVYFIFAGVGSNTGEAPNHVWPHASYYSYPIGGKTIGRYACSCEFYSARQGILDGIGTICHEFSHVLGLEDLYDTDYSGSGGESVTPGTWEIMSGGSYNNYARTPAGYSAYDRYSLGFCTPKVVNAPGTYTLPAFNSGNEALILKTPTANEFFIMENRQLEGWDAYCPGHGMLINHVDSTNVSVWTSNQVNCKPEHNYYKFMPAGGASQSSASDPFPGTGAVTMITNATEPNLLSWAQESCPYIITNIAEEDGNITLKIANDAVIGDVEDFEDMAATTATSLADVQGKYATWSFTKCNVTAPGSGKASGEHSVAMKLPSAITSGDTYYDAYQVSFKVFNPLSMTVKYTLSTSTDGGATWTNAASATGETTQTVSGNGTHMLYWVVNTKQDTPTRYRVILTTGSKTSAVYLDDFTLYYTGKRAGSATGDINGDGVVNVTDVTALINVILGSASYDASLCDINGDGTINVTDVTALLNLILAAE